MKQRNLQNELIDQIGGNLLEASKLQDREIEKIIAAPNLFESVRARIEAKKTSDRAQRVFRDRSKFSILNWKSVTVGGVLAVFLMGAIILTVFTRHEELQVAAINTPAQVEQAENPSPIPDSNEYINNSEGKTLAIPQRAVSKGRTKHIRAKRLPRVEREEVSDFYALTYADDADDGGQIVRVELPRSSLFAMGIDVPVENDTSKVKTDLLIGSDGVMKAVRFVR
jgi:hypothetical protein